MFNKLLTSWCAMAGHSAYVLTALLFTGCGGGYTVTTPTESASVINAAPASMDRQGVAIQTDGQVGLGTAPQSVNVRQIELGWEAPTTNSDGSPLTDLRGYRIYIGETSGSYSRALELNDPTASSFKIQDLGPGTYYMVIRTLSSVGESDLSEEVSKTIL